VSGEDERPEVDLFFQIGPLVQHLNPIREQVETPPQNALVVMVEDKGHGGEVAAPVARKIVEGDFRPSPPASR
jgi:hypothetical protein